MKRKSLLMIMVLSVTVLLAACTPSNPQGGSVAPTTPEVSQAKPAQQTAENVFGQSQQVEGVTIKLLNVVQSKGEGIYAADVGQVFVQPEFEINNQSNKGTKIAIAFNYFVDGISMPQSSLLTAALWAPRLISANRLPVSLGFERQKTGN
jgi:hypothetical protein